MTLTWFLALVSGVGMVALIMYLGRQSRANAFGMREDVDLGRLRETSGTNAPIALFEEVFHTIANELFIRPGQLRASDGLSEIFKVDSWQLGSAQDAIEDLIRKRAANRPPSVDTIQDLLEWLTNEQNQTGGMGKTTHK